MRKITFVLAIALGSSIHLIGQGDAHFSQYVQSPLELNPANAGLFQGNFRAAVNYRRQWENIGEVFQTIGASGDFQLARNVFDRDFFGVGVSVIQDQAGVSSMSNLNANLHLSYTKIMDPRGNHYVSLGFMAGFAQRSFAVSSLRWDQQWTAEGFNPALPSGESDIGESQSNLDLGGGINYFYSNDRESLKFYGGVALFHLNRPEIQFIRGEERLYSRLVVNGGLQYITNDDRVAFFPNFVVTRQGPNHMTVFGGDVRFFLSEGARSTGFLKQSSFAIGAYHRWADAFIPAIKLNTAGFQLGISYDFTIRNLSRTNNGQGGPEFSLVYQLGYGQGMRSTKVNTKFL